MATKRLSDLKYMCNEKHWDIHMLLRIIELKFMDISLGPND